MQGKNITVVIVGVVIHWWGLGGYTYQITVISCSYAGHNGAIVGALRRWVLRRNEERV